MTLEDFKQIFKNYNVPTELIALYHFQYKNNVLYRYPFYADFYLDNTYTWVSDDKQLEKEFNDDVIAFAGSDGAGGYFAFWLQDGLTDLTKTPIIHMDSEGGGDLICKNINDLLTIMTSDLYEGIYDPDMADPSDFITEYRAWAKDTLNIESIIVDLSKAEEYEIVIEVQKMKDEVLDLFGEKYEQWKPKFFHDY